MSLVPHLPVYCLLMVTLLSCSKVEPDDSAGVSKPVDAGENSIQDSQPSASGQALSKNWLLGRWTWFSEKPEDDRCQTADFEFGTDYLIGPDRVLQNPVKRPIKVIQYDLSDLLIKVRISEADGFEEVLHPDGTLHFARPDLNSEEIYLEEPPLEAKVSDPQEAEFRTHLLMACPRNIPSPNHAQSDQAQSDQAQSDQAQSENPPAPCHATVASDLSGLTSTLDEQSPMWPGPTQPWHPISNTPEENWLLGQWALVGTDQTLKEACEWPYYQFGENYYYQRTDIDGSPVEYGDTIAQFQASGTKIRFTVTGSATSSTWGHPGNRYLFKKLGENRIEMIGAPRQGGALSPLTLELERCQSSPFEYLPDTLPTPQTKHEYSVELGPKTEPCK